jgi:hypothetical protein
MTREEIETVAQQATKAVVVFTVPDAAGPRTVEVPLGALLPVLGLPPFHGEAHPLLWAGDRLALSQGFLESALARSKQRPDHRTDYVELTAVQMTPDGGKILTFAKNYCPWCHDDLDERPHQKDDCPALKARAGR